MADLHDIYSLIKSDFTRYPRINGGGVKMILIALSGIDHRFSFSFWLRLSSSKNIFYPLALLMRKKYERKFGLQIPKQTKIGYGFYLGHGIGIVINPRTVIGNNCNLSQFTSIGTNDGKAAIIGDNVYIGPSVCIVGNVCIGNNVTIGAGSVVTKDIPDNATVAGVPAKILNYDNPGKYIGHRFEKK